MDPEKRVFGAWWMFALALIVISTVVFSLLSYAGLIGRTAVEREVFEQSYQRSEGYRERIAILEAALIELRARQAQPNLPESTRAEIETQIVAISAQLRAARSQQ